MTKEQKQFLKRKNEVLALINSGREMEVEIQTRTYSPCMPFPKKSRWIRSCVAMLKLDLPVLRMMIKTIILNKLSASRTSIEPGFSCIYGNIICEGVSLHDTHFVDYGNVFIGSGTGFSYQNIVITSAHDFIDRKTIYAKDVIIGCNVWITSRVTILGGVRIGKNSVIGAGSVVVNDIPENVFAAGVPARPLFQLDELCVNPSRR